MDRIALGATLGEPDGTSSLPFLGTDHLAGLGVIAALGVLVPLAVRRWPESPGVRHIRVLLAAIMAGNLLVWHGRAIALGEWSLEKHLPCHLCDAAAIVSILVLLRPSKPLFELSYFWGLGGALQALLTPDITDGFPHYLYWQFFINHGGLVLTPLCLAFGFRLRLERGAVLRVFVRSNVFMAAAGFTDWVTGANYMFLRSPPPTGSLLDYMGPWPWYIVTGEAVGFVLFYLLALPFRVSGRRREARRVHHPEGSETITTGGS